MGVPPSRSSSSGGGNALWLTANADFVMRIDAPGRSLQVFGTVAWELDLGS